MLPRTENELVRRQPEPEAGPLAAGPVAVPEPEIEVILIRTLVPRETRISDDAHDRAADSRIGVELGSELVTHGLDEVTRRLEQQRLVLLAVRVEPVAAARATLVGVERQLPKARPQ